MALTTVAKMTDRERVLHHELTEEQAKYNGLILSVQEELSSTQNPVERVRLTRELEGYIREAQRIARHKRILEQEVERRHSTPLWTEEASA